MSKEKWGLSVALQGLADVARIVESPDYDPENQVIQRVIKQMLIDIRLPSAVDECFRFDSYLDRAQEECADWIKRFQSQKKRFEEVKKNFRQAGTLKLGPGEKVTGSLGSIAVQSKDKYTLTCTNRPKNEVTPEEIKLHNIPGKFLKEETRYYIDKKACERAYEAGDPVPFLECKKHDYLVLRKSAAARLEK